MRWSCASGIHATPVLICGAPQNLIVVTPGTNDSMRTTFSKTHRRCPLPLTAAFSSQNPSVRKGEVGEVSLAKHSPPRSMPAYTASGASSTKRPRSNIYGNGECAAAHRQSAAAYEDRGK